MPAEPTVEQFLAEFRLLVPEQSRALVERNALVRQDGGDDIRAGARPGQVFALAKRFIDLPPTEIEKLLDSPVHDLRMGALSVMGKQAARKTTPDSRRKELYELYLRRTDRINDWDLVDLSAHYVVGGYLVDRPRDVLYGLARSDDWWERRIALFATLAFVRRGDTDDTFRIAEILVHDPEHFVNTVVGTMLREAGKVDQPRLIAFLDRYAATMPRIALRFSIEKMDPAQRKDYLGRAKQQKAAG
ncbi:MAG TPA: DNA alkylation repair protein [Streptosporangiaceae bacterium]|nr:DNA alkylation repair protein [Streptosporangiaceae bacterium]